MVAETVSGLRETVTLVAARRGDGAHGVKSGRSPTLVTRIVSEKGSSDAWFSVLSTCSICMVLLIKASAESETYTYANNIFKLNKYVSIFGYIFINSDY